MANTNTYAYVTEAQAIGIYLVSEIPHFLGSVPEMDNCLQEHQSLEDCVQALLNKGINPLKAYHHPDLESDIKNYVGSAPRPKRKSYQAAGIAPLVGMNTTTDVDEKRPSAQPHYDKNSSLVGPGLYDNSLAAPNCYRRGLPDKSPSNTLQDLRYSLTGDLMEPDEDACALTSPSRSIEVAFPHDSSPNASCEAQHNVEGLSEACLPVHVMEELTRCSSPICL